MPIAATVIRDALVAAFLAAFDMAAQRRRAARLDGRHHLELIQTDMTGMCGSPSQSVTTEDVGDLQVGAHWPAQSPAIACSPISATILSRGLVTVRTVRVATRV